MPSVGTRGQGTLGDRFAHADRDVMAGEAEPDAAVRAALARADALVAEAVSPALSGPRAAIAARSLTV